MKLLAVVLMAFALVCGNFVRADERMDFFDKELRPLLEGLGKSGPERVDAFNRLIEGVQHFNAITAVDDREVVPLEPRFLDTYLDEHGVNTAALALCASSVDGLRTCEEAALHLLTMTAQCPSVFLGTINLDVYPEVPLDFLEGEFDEPGDPNLVLMVPNPAFSNARTEVRVMGTTIPDTVALVLCPMDSRTFGPAFRSLEGVLGGR